jgi:hypothetical protein
MRDDPERLAIGDRLSDVRRWSSSRSQRTTWLSSSRRISDRRRQSPPVRPAAGARRNPGG